MDTVSPCFRRAAKVTNPFPPHSTSRKKWKPSKQWCVPSLFLGYIFTVFETGHERAAYALRISRSFLQFHPPATKDRFSDDNPLIHCTLHCFSIFLLLSLSLSLSLFFREKLLLANIIFVLTVFTCAFSMILEWRKRGTTLSRRGGKSWKRLGKGWRGESWRDTRDKGEADEESIFCASSFWR